jgi:hypothetical protein
VRRILRAEDSGLEHLFKKFLWITQRIECQKMHFAKVKVGNPIHELPMVAAFWGMDGCHPSLKIIFEEVSDDELQSNYEL